MSRPLEMPKQILLRSNPADRSFAATWKLIQERRNLYGIDPTRIDFKRRRVGVVGIEPLELSPEPIVRPLACGGIDGIDGDPEEPEITIPEVCAPIAPIQAGEDEPEISDETDEDSESDIDQGDADEAHAEAEL